MSTDVAERPRTTDRSGERLTEQVARIRAALDDAGSLLEPRVVARAREDLRAIERRLELGVHHTVVALVGGTGSGKSSLFNAISGLEFADVGALRPTTEVAAACVWDGDAEDLLNFLDVAPTRRIQRVSVLDGHREDALLGMVLLDLPDHDSVAVEHARQVDRLLPLVDLLVWVVDPQKYADHLLHDRYLKALVGRQESMLVLVNQADTVPPEAVEQVRADVAALLATDGLDRVPVLATSALEHTGIAEVREALADAVARPSAAARTVEAELASLAERLAPSVGTADGLDDADSGALVAELCRAGGAGAVESAIRTTVASPGGGALPRPEAPAVPTVAAIRDDWMGQVVRGLAPRWSRAVERAVTGPDELADAVGSALASVPLPPSSSARARLLAALGVVLLVLGVAAVIGWAVSGPGSVLLLVAGALTAVAGGVLLMRSRTARAEDAETLASRYAEQARDAVDGVVREHVVRPAEGVLTRHRALRSSLAG